MKTFLSIAASAALIAAIAIFPQAVVNADAPVVNITAPVAGQAYYTSSFPYQTNITFTVAHNETLPNGQVRGLNKLTNLDVTVNEVSILSGPVNPFTNAGACSTDLLAVSNACSAAGNSNATVSIPWSVPGPGTYTLAVSMKHTNDLGEDFEQVNFAVFSVEHPAPPAVANSFLNTAFTKAQLTAKKRGCVISQIAGLHASEEKYGPKGGPYNTSVIEADAMSFFSTCP